MPSTILAAIKARVEHAPLLSTSQSPVFATTHWSVIQACSHLDESQAAAALAEVCQAYWLPVYACIRHQGYSIHDAQDLTQDFFVRLLDGKYFRCLDQSKGRFRAYLSTALRNFLRDRWRRWTLRRGRAVTIIPLDASLAEASYSAAPATKITPESLYEQRWAQLVLKHALEQLRIELAADRKEILFDYFEGLLAGSKDVFSTTEIASALGLTPGALHNTLHRWRARFQALMREEIGRTVISKSEIEAELEHLLRVVSRSPEA